MIINEIFNEPAESFMEKLPDNSFDLIIADPPYGIAKPKPLVNKSKGRIQTLSEKWDIFESHQKYLSFTKLWLNQAFRILKSKGSIFVYGSRKSIFDMKQILDEAGYYFLDMITWVKRDSMPNCTQRGYSYSTEFILWYCKSDSGWTFNHKALKKYNNGKQMRNYWDIPRSLCKEEKTPHKTQKNVLLSDIIVDGHSNAGDLVYIPFGGSGSEIESCIKLNRKWIATEINKLYISDIIIPRITALGYTNNQLKTKLNHSISPYYTYFSLPRDPLRPSRVVSLESILIPGSNGSA